MGKLSRILITLVGLVCVVLIGLAIFVHFYLTEDRVKALIIPPAEEALGRKVHIGSIDVGLFTGITVEDFSVKEDDGETDFLSTGEFVLRYNLWPLLQGAVVVSKVRLDEPRVCLLRDKQGRFNFETLAFLAGGEEKKAEPEPGTEAGPALPLALTVEQVKTDRAQVVVRDATGEIPDTDAKADLVVALDVGRDLASLSYKGNLSFVADIVYGEVKPNISGKSDFDQDRLGYAVDVILDDQKARLSGEVKDYAKVPDIRLDITSEVMDIDRLLAVLAVIPAASEAGEKRTPEVTKVSDQPPGAALPSGLRASGELRVGRTIYKGLEVKDVLTRYNLEKGVLTVEDFSAGVAEGQVSSRMKADLNKPGLIYGGELDINSVKVQGLLPALANVSGDMVSGVMESHFTFSGAGTEWPVLRDALSVEGTYALRDGEFRDIPVTTAIAKLLGLEELKRLSFESLDGTLHVIKGKAALKSRMSGKDVVGARAEGTIGLDGNLDMPVTLLLSQALSEKLRKRASVAKYLTSEEGQTELRLKLAGSLMRPYPTLDTAGVSEQVKETIRKKAVEKLDEALTGKKKEAGEEDADAGKDAGKEIIRGILGR